MKLEELNGRYLFTAAWCGPCKVVKARIPPSAEFILVDVDEHKELIKEINEGPKKIKSVPSLGIFKDGVLIDSFTGSPDILANI